MKRKYKYRTTLFFWIMSIIVAAVVISVIVTSVVYLNEENWISVLTSVTKDLITAIVVTFIVGAFFKMITEKFFLVKKNDRLLRKFGVLNVGTGISTKSDVHSIFGYKFLNTYPQEIHMLYITGNVYLSTFKDELIECLKHGSKVRILLVSTDKENIGFVNRLEKIYGKEANEFSKQIDDVKKLIDELKIEYPNQISLRFYQDEYFYNFRSAKYYDEKKGIVFYKSNINVQPFNMPAADCSIGLSGTYKDTDNNLDGNIFYLNDKTFDKLWQKYEKTNYC